MSDTHAEHPRPYRLGVVSFLNAKPLIAGLEDNGAVEIVFDVPARLANRLDQGLVDAALVPVIDYHVRANKWQIVSDACIGCDGETLTVRVFSRVEPERLSVLHVDGDSHTSVILAQVIWERLFGRKIEVEPLAKAGAYEQCEAVLLIGDKVVTETLVDHPIQIDLGTAWKSMTSMPFVFAVWAACKDFPASDLAVRLATARDRGVRATELIAEDYAPGMGWPVELAKRYLSKRLDYTMSDRHRAGMKEFLSLADRFDAAGVAGTRD